jgi:hypothetical protein
MPRQNMEGGEHRPFHLRESKLSHLLGEGEGGVR